MSTVLLFFTTYVAAFVVDAVVVVIAFVVDVVPLTTVTGPFTPDVPKVSAACAKGEVSNPRSRTPRITFLFLDTIAT